MTCISFFNKLPLVFMRGRDVYDRTSFVILCNASMKKNGQSATTHTSLYTYTDISGGIAKINLQTRLKLTVFMLIQSSNVISTPSCFLNIVTSTHFIV